ncbi:MAG: metal-sensitive transcriptional regulator [Candidatus Roizmanbacteria bacterium]
MKVLSYSKQIDSRMNRLIGQLEGIRRMIHSGRSSGDIVQQIQASKQALSKIGMTVLKEGILSTPASQKNKIGKMIEKVFGV